MNEVQCEVWSVGRLIPYSRNPRKNDQHELNIFPVVRIPTSPRQ